MQEFENKFEGHTIHVCHRQYADDAVTPVDGFAQHMLCKVVVRPKRTVGNHHTLRKTRRSRGVVDHRHLFAILFNIIMYVFLAEILRELLAVQLVQVFTGIRQLVRTRNHE